MFLLANNLRYHKRPELPDQEAPAAAFCLHGHTQGAMAAANHYGIPAGASALVWLLAWGLFLLGPGPQAARLEPAAPVPGGRHPDRILSRRGGRVVFSV